jgi:UDP-glucose 6-dehydrogenase
MLRYATVNSVDIPMLTGVWKATSGRSKRWSGVLAHQPRQVGLIGLAFKRDTDDMRESPYVAIASA